MDQNQKGFSAIAGIIIGLVILSAVVAGSYLVVKNRKSQPVVQDETADWKTYRNEKYGYEIKYPPGWFASYNQRGNELTFRNYKDFNSPFIPTSVDGVNIDVPCNLDILSGLTPTDEGLSLRDYVAAHNSGQPISGYRKVVINGLESLTSGNGAYWTIYNHAPYLISASPNEGEYGYPGGTSGGRAACIKIGDLAIKTLVFYPPSPQP